MGELRSKAGLISHGALDFKYELELAHSRYIVKSTDTIVEFLTFASRNFWTNFQEEINYEDNSEFNDFMDSATISEDVGEYISISNLNREEVVRVRRSEIIFRLDTPQYENLLKEHVSAGDGDSDE